MALEIELDPIDYGPPHDSLIVEQTGLEKIPIPKMAYSDNRKTSDQPLPRLAV